MKPSRSLGLACGLLALPLFVFGQSLGEAARKERERRQDSSHAGTQARAVSGEDLAANEGRLANDPGAAEAPEIEESPEAVPPAQGQIVSVDPAPRTRGRGEQFWRARVAGARGRVESATRRYNELLRQIRFGQPVRLDPSGRRVIHSAQTMKAKADAAEEEMKRAEEGLAHVLEEARRDGALPGWLR